MWQGILVVNKERGLTSHQVVARLRRILNQSAAGHTGTLDPEASGVLVVGLGQASRIFPFLNESVKLYRAQMILGQSTDSHDATGKVLSEVPSMKIGLAQLQAALAELTGEQNQTPPMFSAVKLKGRKLYELARQGLEVERPSRTITVHHWRLLNPQQVYSFQDRLECEISCSRGTYIRSLAHDLGLRLGCGAHLSALVRLASGEFTLKQALTLDEVQQLLDQGRLGQHLLSLNQVLGHLAAFTLTEPGELAKVTHGAKLSYDKYPLALAAGSRARILDPGGELLGIAELRPANDYLYWQPIKILQYGNGLNK